MRACNKLILFYNVILFVFLNYNNALTIMFYLLIYSTVSHHYSIVLCLVLLFCDIFSAILHLDVCIFSVMITDCL